MRSESIPVRKDNRIRKEIARYGEGRGKVWQICWVCRHCGLRWALEERYEAFSHKCGPWR